MEGQELARACIRRVCETQGGQRVGERGVAAGVESSKRA